MHGLYPGVQSAAVGAGAGGCEAADDAAAARETAALEEAALLAAAAAREAAAACEAAAREAAALEEAALLAAAAARKAAEADVGALLVVGVVAAPDPIGLLEAAFLPPPSAPPTAEPTMNTINTAPTAVSILCRATHRRRPFAAGTHICHPAGADGQDGSGVIPVTASSRSAPQASLAVG